MTTITARQLINLAVDYYYLGDGSDFYISRVELHSRLLNSLGQLQNLTIRNVGKLVIQVIVILISLFCYYTFLFIITYLGLSVLWKTQIKEGNIYTLRQEELS